MVFRLGDGLSGDGLRRDVHARQNHTVACTEDCESESEDGRLGALIKQGEQAARDNRDAPAEPDRPAKVAEARSENGHDDGARDEQADCGKEIDACADRRGATHRHPVEGNIVEGCEELDVGQR